MSIWTKLSVALLPNGAFLYRPDSLTQGPQGQVTLPGSGLTRWPSQNINLYITMHKLYFALSQFSWFIATAGLLHNCFCGISQCLQIFQLVCIISDIITHVNMYLYSFVPSWVALPFSSGCVAEVPLL
jgi:hypothetical protein